MSEKLDLDALTKDAEQFVQSSTGAWRFFAGSYFGSVMDVEHEVALSHILEALPRLIELARIGQSVGELEDGEQLAILKPPREAEQWYIDPDDV